LTLYIGLYIGLGVAITAAYAAIGAIVHGLFERRSLLKHGHSLEKRRTNAKKYSIEYKEAETAEIWAHVVSILWFCAPVLFTMCYAGKLLLWFHKVLQGLHKGVMYARLESKGASDKDSKTGAYRS